MFMRVRRTVPQFTFSLSERFVNRISSVSTGFFRFFSVLFEIRYIFPTKPQENEEILLLQRLHLVSILSQHKVSHVAPIVFNKLDIRIERRRKKLRLRLRSGRNLVLT